MPTILTYLTDTGRAGEHPIRAGDRVHLRAAAGASETETWSECGRLLGRLPPAERSALAAFDAGQILSAHVAAVVPRSGPLGPRDPAGGGRPVTLPRPALGSGTAPAVDASDGARPSWPRRTRRPGP